MVKTDTVLFYSFEDIGSSDVLHNVLGFEKKTRSFLISYYYYLIDDNLIKRNLIKNIC